VQCYPGLTTDIEIWLHDWHVVWLQWPAILSAGLHEKTSPMKPPLKIGWRESIALPTLGLGCVLAKIDTGAKTSALHVSHIEQYRKRGVWRVRFTSYDLREGKHVPVQCDMPVVDERIVTDSSGHRQNRLVIATDLNIGEITWPVELTLADRSQMKYRMLIGRSALRRGMLIDAKRSYLTRKK